MKLSLSELKLTLKNKRDVVNKYKGDVNMRKARAPT